MGRSEHGAQQERDQELLAELPVPGPELALPVRTKRQGVDEDRSGANQLDIVGHPSGGCPVVGASARYGVNDGEIFTDYLESSLSDMEVINLSVTAYGLRQEIDYFKRLGIKFAPDVVVLALVMNDIHDARDREKGEQPKTTKDLKSVPDRNFFRPVKQALAGNSALYALLHEVTNQYKFVVDIRVRIGMKESPLGFGRRWMKSRAGDGKSMRHRLRGVLVRSGWPWVRSPAPRTWRRP